MHESSAAIAAESQHPAFIFIWKRSMLPPHSTTLCQKMASITATHALVIADAVLKTARPTVSGIETANQFKPHAKHLRFQNRKFASGLEMYKNNTFSPNEFLRHIHQLYKKNLELT
jgi:hypothetical protein